MATSATGVEEDDHSIADVEPIIKEEVEIVKPAVPQLELSRRISDSDDETGGGIARTTSVKDQDEEEPLREDEEIDDDEDEDKKGIAGKIKIEYIENRRARGATFNKRRNGILKKAFELSQLTGTVVCAVVFNEQRTKLYEYCSEEPSDVFTRIATYYGYCERRRNDTLRNPRKGYVNVAQNEPMLASAARAAASTAAIRHSHVRLASLPQKRNKHNNVKVPAILPRSPLNSSLPTNSSNSVTSSADIRIGEDDNFIEVPTLTLNNEVTDSKTSAGGDGDHDDGNNVGGDAADIDDGSVTRKIKPETSIPRDIADDEYVPLTPPSSPSTDKEVEEEGK